MTYNKTRNGQNEPRNRLEKETRRENEDIGRYDGEGGGRQKA